MRSPEHCPTVELLLARRDYARPTWVRIVEDQVSADIGRVVQVSKSDLMARGVALNLLQMAKELARSAKPPNMKICPGRKASPWTASLAMIEGAIKTYGDDTVELSMKAPMSVSKPADLG